MALNAASTDGDSSEGDISIVFENVVHHGPSQPAPEVVIVGEVSNRSSQNDDSSDDGVPEFMAYMPDNGQQLKEVSDGDESDGVDLRDSSDSERQYDSDEKEPSSDSSLEAMIDYRNASDLSVNSGKDYIELLDERLERRMKKLKKKAMKKKKGCNCHCHKKNNGGGGRRDDGHGKGGHSGGGAKARRRLVF
ncbi:hypothetical protein AAVH_32516 [Aphelenchoides avenae]|nr:hypothetical protein AAVH_32516 [Aphelenchus avenae]